jgi:hypothetical protein
VALAAVERRGLPRPVLGRLGVPRELLETGTFHDFYPARAHSHG